MSTDAQKCALRCSEIADVHATNGVVLLSDTDQVPSWKYMCADLSVVRIVPKSYRAWGLPNGLDKTTHS